MITYIVKYLITTQWIEYVYAHCVLSYNASSITLWLFEWHMTGAICSPWGPIRWFCCHVCFRDG